MTGTPGIPFWKRPEGKLGAVVGVALAALFGYGLFLILPFLVTMAANTFVLALYALGIAGLFYVTVLDSSLRNLLVNFYKRFIRALYILSFNVDPVGGLKERIKELRTNNAVARQRVGEMNGQAELVKKTIEDNRQVIDRGLRIMEAAKNSDQPDRAHAESVKVGLAKNANLPLEALHARIVRSMDQLKDIIRKSEIQVDVLDTAVQIKERSYKVSKSSRSALRAAMEALRGDTEKNSRFQDNMDWVDEFVANVAGEMESTLDLNKDALDSIDLEQQSWSDEAFKMLEERQSSVQHLLSDGRAQALIAGQFVPNATPMQQPVAAPKSGEFSHLFDPKGK